MPWSILAQFCLLLLSLPLSLTVSASSEGEGSASFDSDGVGPMVVPNNELYCPGGEAISELKQNVVQIGVIGCEMDLVILSSSRNEECWAQVFEHNYTGTPDYLIAILYYFEHVNRNPTMLPYHRLCVLPSLSASVEDNILWTYSKLILEDIVVVIDGLLPEISRYVQNVFLPLSIPIVQVSDTERLSLIPFKEVIRGFKCNFECESKGRRFQTSTIHFRSIMPPIEVYSTIRNLAKSLGWKRIGLISGCDQFSCQSSRRYDSHRISRDGFDVFFSNYNPSNPLETFRLFIQEEIQIFTFHGNPSVYLDVLLLAAKYNFIGPK